MEAQKLDQDIPSVSHKNMMIFHVDCSSMFSWHFCAPQYINVLCPLDVIWNDTVSEKPYFSPLHSSTGGAIILRFSKLIPVRLYNKARLSAFSSKSRTLFPKSKKRFYNFCQHYNKKKTYFNLQLGQLLSFRFVYRFVFRDESIRFGWASSACCVAHQKVWIMAYSFLVCFSGAACRHNPHWTPQHNKNMAGCIPSWPISQGVSLIKEIEVACHQTRVEMTALAVVVFILSASMKWKFLFDCTDSEAKRFLTCWKLKKSKP